LAAIDLLRRLICDANERLGVNGVEEIKLHPFFAGIDWKRIRDKKSPYVPELKSEIDTSHFDQFEEEEPWYVEDSSKARKVRKNANFIGYTFKRDAERKYLVSALEQLEATKTSHIRQGAGAQTKAQPQPQRQVIETLETQSSDTPSNGGGGNPTAYIQNLGTTSANNITSALNSIIASNNPKASQNVTHSQLQQAQPTSSTHVADNYYSSTNYSNAKSPKSTVTSTKQTFFKMPDPKDRLESKLKTTGLGEGPGIKKYASPNMPTSSKVTGANITSSSKGFASGLYKGAGK